MASFNFGSMDFQTLIFTIVLFAGVMFLLGYLVILAVVVRDYQFIVDHPLNFAVETVLWATIPCVPLFYFAISRNISMTVIWTWAISLSVKFVIFHILLQLSGVYSSWFRS